MTRARKTAPKSEVSFKPKGNQFASRPFAQRIEEHEAPAGESRVSFSIADIDIFTRETVQPKLTHEMQQNVGMVQQGQMQEAGRVLQAKEEARPNRTGIPDRLKSGLEALSAMDLSGVRVHRNSPKPAQLNALAFTQGQEIHVAPGQEKHLPHEGWHVVQQMQGRVRATMQLKDGIPVNDDDGMEHEADVMGEGAIRLGIDSATVRSSICQQFLSVRETMRRRVQSDSGKVVQRQIKGLDEYSDYTKIPDQWFEAYKRDITNSCTHLTDGNLLYLYRHVRGKTPDSEGVIFLHKRGNHWDVKIGEKEYITKSDGSCALHAVDLADRVLNGESINPEVPYSADEVNLYNFRQVIFNQLVEEGPDESKKAIASGISNSEDVIGSGFGPDLSRLLNLEVQNKLEKSVLLRQEDIASLFDLAYTRLWKGMSLPKPSEAKKILKKKDFFSRVFPTLLEMMARALAIVFNTTNSGMQQSFEGEPYTKLLEECIRDSLQSFGTKKEAAAALHKIEVSPRARRGAKKRALPGRKLLPSHKSEMLKKKMNNPMFVRKLMKASQIARKRLTKSSSDIASLVAKGQSDLTSRQLSSRQKIAAFSAFKKRKTKEKSNLQFDIGSGNKTSFGKGGFQVKGLGTYLDEVRWFESKLKKWKCSEADLFAAMEERSRVELIRLTGNEQDANHLLRFADLQLLERWRGGPFGVGVAAWARAGYHGLVRFSQYILRMPLMEDGATTNVSETKEFDAPHNEELWKRQQQSTVEGIQQMMEIEIPPGGVYDERTRAYLEQAADESEKGEPSTPMIEASAEFMQSPRPYQNEDADIVMQEDIKTV